MSMKVYLGMQVDSIKERLASRHDDDKTRVDTDLPLGIRMGSRVQIEETPFLLAGDNICVKFPGTESLVGAYSESEMMGLNTYRFYLKSRATGVESMLMFVLDDAGHVAERYLFTEQAEIPLNYVSLDEVPAGGDAVNAVNFWIGEQGGIIGQPIFITPDEVEYIRLWQTDINTGIPPLQFDEKIVMDPYGDSSLKVEHLGTMLYSRTVDGLADQIDEFMLPAVESDEEGFRTRVWVGMLLAADDLKLPDAI